MSVRRPENPSVPLTAARPALVALAAEAAFQSLGEKVAGPALRGGSAGPPARPAAPPPRQLSVLRLSASPFGRGHLPALLIVLGTIIVAAPAFVVRRGVGDFRQEDKPVPLLLTERTGLQDPLAHADGGRLDRHRGPDQLIASVTPPELRQPGPNVAIVEPNGRPPDATKTRSEQLLARAQAMLRLGNPSGARLVLDLLVDDGSGEAAFLLAESYDSRAKSDLQPLAGDPDDAKATELYRLARARGVARAAERIARNR